MTTAIKNAPLGRVDRKIALLRYVERLPLPAEMQTQALPPTSYPAAYSTKANPQSEFVEAASAAPFGGLMEVLDEHMSAIKLAYPKEYELVMRKITAL